MLERLSAGLSGLAAIAATTIVTMAAAATFAIAADPYGTWVRPSTGTTVSFYSCGGGLCAKIVGVKDPAKKDTVGKVIMSGAKKTGENKWEGNLLNTDNGNTYSGYVTLDGGGLKLEGCALGGVLCSGETWRRVN